MRPLASARGGGDSFDQVMRKQCLVGCWQVSTMRRTFVQGCQHFVRLSENMKGSLSAATEKKLSRWKFRIFFQKPDRAARIC